MIIFFLSPYHVVTRISMSTVFFLAQLESWILCLQNVFLGLIAKMAFSLELIGTLYLRALSHQLFFILFSCSLVLFLATLCLVLTALNVQWSEAQFKNTNLLIKVLYYESKIH